MMSSLGVYAAGKATELSIDLSKAVTVTNSDLASPRSPDAARRTLENDLTLRIQAVSPQDGQYEFNLCGRLITDPSIISGITHKTHENLFVAVNECREVWSSTVVNFLDRQKNRTPFQEEVDFSTRPELLQQIGADLAVAGNKMFFAVFLDKADSDLRLIASRLRELLRSPRYLAVSSDKIFLPWGLMYTHPVAGEELDENGSNWDKRGFWGYSHVIQQSPKHFHPDSRLVPEDDGKMRLSANFDNRLPRVLGLKCIGEHIESLKSFGSLTLRTNRAELVTAFSKQRETLERLVYFFCHGHGATTNGIPTTALPYLKLSDDGKVSSEDFRYWAKDKPLPSAPLIFFNACQGGQMDTLFYKSFACELLSQGAAGVVGAQIDVPGVFAVAYANALFANLFDATCSLTLGPLMRQNSQDFWDNKRNPLALIFSLYRGVDCYIEWPNPPNA
jgi:hypothetical protein